MFTHPEKRFSAAYLEQIRRRPAKAHLPYLAELAEFYDDAELRAAVAEHPDWHSSAWVIDESRRAPATGAVERMLVAEAMTHPGVRQVDLARSMGLTSTVLGDLTYFLGKARILDRQTVGGRVILGPGKRCAEIGLGAEAAQALIATRESDPQSWHATVRRLTGSQEDADEATPGAPDELGAVVDLDGDGLVTTDGHEVEEFDIAELFELVVRDGTDGALAAARPDNYDGIASIDLTLDCADPKIGVWELRVEIRPAASEDTAEVDPYDDYRET
ncbi:MAG: hypothetical protein KIH64_005490, partial [Mycobacterium sp.]|nr:hypothetical protein [Mycobacterium sp.]